MILTEENFNVYAAAYYDNPFCLSEEEFLEDLRQHVTIRRMMSKYLKEDDINIKLLVNNIIIFYNCFDHHAATEMLQMKIDEDHIEYFNSVLKFLSLPMLIPPQTINEEFYKRLQEEFR